MANTAKLKEALNAYTGDVESLNRFAEAAGGELGENWVQTIDATLTDLTAEEQSRLDHAVHYHNALAAWTEIQGYLAQPEPLDVAFIQGRIPVLSEGLAFFGEPGENAVIQLAEKIGLDTTVPVQEPPIEEGTEESVSETVQESNPVSEAESTSVAAADITPQTPIADAAPVSDTTPEPIWEVEKALKQLELMQSVQAWITARCIELGNIESFYYPYYGFFVDLMQQTLNDINALLSTTESLAAINRAYPDTVRLLQNMQISIGNDLEIARQNMPSAETPLTKESLSGADLKQILGRLDTSGETEYLGPAPDGFEPITDPYEALDEQPIKEEYKRIENVILSEQKTEVEKRTSQTPQNGVKRKLSFSLGNKINKPSEE